jgi:hypothetical protein
MLEVHMHEDNTNSPPLEQLLKSLGYNHDFILALTGLRAHTSPDLASIRKHLEDFFRTTANFAPRLRGVDFKGDIQSFGQLRQFIREREWLTKAEEDFIKGYYSVLSANVHPGKAVFDGALARDILLYIVALVIDRLGRPVLRPIQRMGTAGDKHDIATAFLRNLRKGRHLNRAPAIYFDFDLMDLSRRLVRPADVPLLLAIVKNDAAHAEVRNCCASLILAPRASPDHAERARIVEDLCAYYRENRDTLPWLAARAIALAVANRANTSDVILHYLQRLSRDPQLVEANLAETERYYQGAQRAIEFYLKRLRNSEIPSSGCVWEVFYLSHRSRMAGKGALHLLKERLRNIEAPDLQAFWAQAIVRLESELST